MMSVKSPIAEERTPKNVKSETRIMGWKPPEDLIGKPRA
jgi:hypothetical protein